MLELENNRDSEVGKGAQLSAKPYGDMDHAPSPPGLTEDDRQPLISSDAMPNGDPPSLMLWGVSEGSFGEEEKD